MTWPPLSKTPTTTTLSSWSQQSSYTDLKKNCRISLTLSSDWAWMDMLCMSVLSLASLHPLILLFNPPRAGRTQWHVWKKSLETARLYDKRGLGIVLIPFITLPFRSIWGKNHGIFIPRCQYKNDKWFFFSGLKSKTKKIFNSQWPNKLSHLRGWNDKILCFFFFFYCQKMTEPIIAKIVVKYFLVNRLNN